MNGSAGAKQLATTPSHLIQAERRARSYDPGGLPVGEFELRIECIDHLPRSQMGQAIAATANMPLTAFLHAGYAIAIPL